MLKPCLRGKPISELVRRPFWHFLKQHPRAVFLGMSFLVITNGLDAYWPLLLRQGLDQLERREPLDQLAKTCLIFLAFMAGLALSRYGWRRYFGEFHTLSAETLRKKIFYHINKMGGSFFQKTSVGELMSLITNDVQSFRQAIGPGFLIFADGVIIIAFVLPIMIYINPSWTWKTLIALPILPFLIWKVMRLIHTTFKVQQDRLADITGFCHETVGGVRVLKGFAREENRSQNFSRLNQTYIHAANQNALVDSFFAPLMEFGIASGTVILLFISMSDILAGTVTVGTFVAYHRYIQKMVWPMTALGFGLSFFQKGFASFSRIKALLVTEPEIVDEGHRHIEFFESLEFRNVSFKYPGSEHFVLKNISFRLEKNQSLAVIGPVGSGKSTLFNLLLRVYPLQQGEIFINGLLWTDLSLASLRQLICLVPQDPFLYSRTVRDNLALEGHLAAPDKIEQAADQAQVLQEIESLPLGWQSQLGEKGVNLSGGQKQRLTLARGLLSPAHVLIFDDVLSAVDVTTEEKIEEQIFRQSKKSIIVAAHRLSTVRHLSQVLVLNGGEVEYFGNWADSKLSKTLQKISQLQETRSPE